MNPANQPNNNHTPANEVEHQKLEHLLSIEEGLNSISHIDRLIDFIVQKTSLVLQAQRCSLMFLDENTQELCIKGHCGLGEEIVRQSRIKLGSPIAGLVAEDGKPILVTDIERDYRFARKSKKYYLGKSFICVPIQLKKRMMGVINVADKHSQEGDVFTAFDLKILSMIARQVATSIEVAKLYREINYLNILDPITNLFNYRYFVKSLDQEISRLQRYSGSLCLLLIDIDDFKAYNDLFGYREGNALLKQIGQVLNENFRDADIACRYAGDEFAIILPETRVDEAQTVVEKINRIVGDLSLQKKITFSAGIAKYAAGMHRYDLIMKAEAALFDAKREGKNRVLSYD